MKSGGLPKVSPMIIATEVFESEDDVANAIAMLDGTELNGNTLLALNFIGPYRNPILPLSYPTHRIHVL